MASSPSAQLPPAKPSRLQLPMPDAENCRDRLLWFDHRVSNFLSEHDIPRAPDLIPWWMRDLDRKSLETAFASMYTLVIQGTDGLQMYDNQYISHEAREKRRVKWLRETNSDLLTENTDKSYENANLAASAGQVNTVPAGAKRATLPRLDDSLTPPQTVPGTVPHASGVVSPTQPQTRSHGSQDLGKSVPPPPSKSPSLPTMKRLSGSGSLFGRQ